MQSFVTGRAPRSLSLPKSLAAMGSIDDWNARSPESTRQYQMVYQMCTATTVEEAMIEVDAIMALDHNIWTYTYMRCLYNKNLDLFYALLLSDPAKMMPVVYTPTVGEACQKFGDMPFFSRGCYVSIADSGNFAAVLRDYAAAHLMPGDVKAVTSATASSSPMGVVFSASAISVHGEWAFPSGSWTCTRSVLGLIHGRLCR